MQNLKTVFTIISLLFTISVWAQPTAPTKAQKDSLKNEIETMMVGDQKYRWMIQLGEMDEKRLDSLKKLESKEKYKRMQYVGAGKVGISRAQKDSLSNLQSIIDTANFRKISCIIKKFGYPKKYVPSYHVTTILQHNSDLLTDDHFKILKQEVLNNNMPAEEYATLYDRAQFDRKLPELYYLTDYYSDAQITNPAKSKDIDVINKAREEIGLKKLPRP